MAALGFLLVLWLAFGALLLPLKRRLNEEVTFVIKVTGNDPAIAETVRGLIWLRQGISLSPHIVIADAGMDEDTLECARQLTETYGGVRIVSVKEVE
jgi:hypothetical protein